MLWKHYTINLLLDKFSKTSFQMDVLCVCVCVCEKNLK